MTALPRAADRAGHRRDRLHRPPPRAGADDRRPPGDRARARSREGRDAQPAVPADHRPVAAARRHAHRRDRQSRRRAGRERAVDRRQAPPHPRLAPAHDRQRRAADPAARAQARRAGQRLGDRLVRRARATRSSPKRTTAGRASGVSVCGDWERAAVQAERFGVRVVRLRIGLRARHRGRHARATCWCRSNTASAARSARAGSGMSWIALDDMVRLIAHAIATPSLTGPVNATAPEPVRNATFTRELGRALHRPAFLRLPAAPLRLIGGDMAEGLAARPARRVVPDKALKTRASCSAIRRCAARSPRSSVRLHRQAVAARREGHSALRHAGM